MEQQGIMIVLMKVLELGHQMYSPEQYQKTPDRPHVKAWKVQPLGEVVLDKPLPKDATEKERA
jgi:hypothetical protein